MSLSLWNTAFAVIIKNKFEVWYVVLVLVLYKSTFTLANCI